MVNKNEVYEITIEDIGTEGQGIGHVDGEAVFVKDTLPGDTASIKIIKAKKNLAYGRLMEIIKPSGYRTTPLCDVARSCGGCTLQHMDYDAQLKYKWDKVKNLLQRIGGISEPEKLMESAEDKKAYGLVEPFHYRNKMQFPVGYDKEGKAVLGFYAGRTHSIIPLSDCVIGHPVNKFIIKAVKEFIDRYKISIYDEEKHKGLIRHVLTRVGFHTNELMVCMVINGNDIPHYEKLHEMISSEVAKFGGEILFKSFMININKDKTNRILGFDSKVLIGDPFISDYIGDVKFNISPQSFFQVNPEMTEKLYSKALEYAALSGGEKVWDMYCGIGTISLFLAEKAGNVYGVEIVPQAIDDAKNNAKLNDIKNVEFHVGKAEEVVPGLYEKDRERYTADVVVVDPPRKGCDEKLLETLVSMAPARLVYVSCDPATLARDIKYLTDHNFELKKVAVFDQFSHGIHVETVVQLINKNAKAKHHVRISMDAEDYYSIKDSEKKEEER
ncbi:23S rRNA (uracil(1939)-C(5))-methyltransferase RlmD [Eubacterium ruminantium]|uniref:23S rRNA (Uracil1939-C5)-methyltransferase n=1 Tax=Eubacterium ruminantium TaxID=42322 RepID=A0A1T4LDS4_9FIRM|nr:23S rRNA (uracil(1939)-C(5))-methyltransferase RlmD [Eubacterium ruminantium]SCW65566.1 23S rRNA (uracil1939-C5)-methyltransferase [Eubacterium ruminantium]SDN25751.1 23S rRNA m(5)U-1939 methyltransferase [Eubacterium ruminantium]SJZ52813.1 23S rRNA (uracil1939-C5)-methyltransferase [Eubacterium ruminantium]